VRKSVGAGAHEAQQFAPPDDSASAYSQRVACHVQAGNLGSTGCRPQQRAEQVDRGRVACSVRSEEPELFSFIHLERPITNCAEIAEPTTE
jgi:hypothetical protein